MTRYLLDTQVLIWLLLGEKARVSPAAKTALEGAAAPPMVSAVSVWEIAIKRSKGKLNLESRWMDQLLRLDLEQRPVSARHAARVESLPWHHKDPFDRLLIAHAIEDDLVVVTADEAFAAYDVPVLW